MIDKAAETAPDDRAAMIWCPFADHEEAARIAKIAVGERLVACANLLPSVDSIFLWDGALEEAQECGALFKTTSALLEQAVDRIEQLHSYDTPAVVGWRIDYAPRATREWLLEAVGHSQRP